MGTFYLLNIITFVNYCLLSSVDSNEDLAGHLHGHSNLTSQIALRLLFAEKSCC
jgi:hypothetical protein